MREHLRSLIDEAQQQARSRTNTAADPPRTTPTEQLASDAVRLARVAAAVHMAESAPRQQVLLREMLLNDHEPDSLVATECEQ